MFLKHALWKCMYMHVPHVLCMCKKHMHIHSTCIGSNWACKAHACACTCALHTHVLYMHTYCACIACTCMCICTYRAHVMHACTCTACALYVQMQHLHSALQCKTAHVERMQHMQCMCSACAVCTAVLQHSASNVHFKALSCAGTKCSAVHI